MGAGTANLRDRRRQETRRMIQSHAIRLFAERGYDATTVAEVADVAGVSAMTVYRHFPTKEDLVLTDEFDPLIAARVAARPADEPLVRRIGGTLVEVAAVPPGPERDLLLTRLKLMIDTPALRARHLDTQFATQQAIVDALAGTAAEFEIRSAAGACQAAALVGLMHWAGQDGRADLPGLIRDALRAAFGDQF